MEEFLEEGRQKRAEQLQKDVEYDLFQQQQDDELLASFKSGRAAEPQEDYDMGGFLPEPETGARTVAEAPMAGSATGAPVAAADLTSFVKEFEGFYSRPYWDHKQWSIGHGTKATGREGPISKEEAAVRLGAELSKAQAHVLDRAKKYGYDFTPNEIDALTSFAYNVGNIDQLTDKGKRSKVEIAKAMLAYNKASGKVLKGLSKRRAAERDLFLSGYKKD